MNTTVKGGSGYRGYPYSSYGIMASNGASYVIAYYLCEIFQQR